MRDKKKCVKVVLGAVAVVVAMFLIFIIIATGVKAEGRVANWDREGVAPFWPKPAGTIGELQEIFKDLAFERKLVVGLTLVEPGWDTQAVAGLAKAGVLAGNVRKESFSVGTEFGWMLFGPVSPKKAEGESVVWSPTEEHNLEAFVVSFDYKGENVKIVVAGKCVNILRLKKAAETETPYKLIQRDESLRPADRRPPKPREWTREDYRRRDEIVQEREEEIQINSRANSVSDPRINNRSSATASTGSSSATANVTVNVAGQRPGGYSNCPQTTVTQNCDNGSGYGYPAAVAPSSGFNLAGAVNGIGGAYQPPSPYYPYPYSAYNGGYASYPGNNYGYGGGNDIIIQNRVGNQSGYGQNYGRGDSGRSYSRGGYSNYGSGYGNNYYGRGGNYGGTGRVGGWQGGSPHGGGQSGKGQGYGGGGGQGGGGSHRGPSRGR